MTRPAQPVRVRMAPSPTGYFHLGSARTALFNWLYARHTGGKFILRIEDTDRTRYVPDSLQDIIDSLRWLGLDYDEGPEVGGDYGPYFQSRAAADLPSVGELADPRGPARTAATAPRSGWTRCARSRRRARKTPSATTGTAATSPPRSGRSWRRRAPRRWCASPCRSRARPPSWTSCARSSRSRTSQVRDPILIKSDGFPTYHFANVIDDHFMEITHILRGDEWLSSVPLHVNLYHALGWEMPVFAHLPLILDPSGVGKLSKRKKRAEGDEELLTFIREYREAGYLPEAMFNFLAIMGWSYSADTDLFTREQAIAKFDIADINPAAGALPMSKLDWMNGHYIRQLGPGRSGRAAAAVPGRGLGHPAGALRGRPGAADRSCR